MARRKARLDGKQRVATLVSFANIMRFFPEKAVRDALRKTGRESQRERELPAPLVCLYAIALCLFTDVSCEEVLRCLVEARRWISPKAGNFEIPSKGAISMARTRLGASPLKELYGGIVRPLAEPSTKGAFYKSWRLNAIDGTVLDLQDTGENSRRFGRPPASRGDSAFPQLRAVALAECGTHVLYGVELSGVRTSEVELAHKVVRQLRKGDLNMADRNFFSFRMWGEAGENGADRLWRVKKNLILKAVETLPDGSFLAKIYADQAARRYGRDGVTVRVVEYRIKGMKGGERIRLMTSILDHEAAPAEELAALYHERWEIETSFDELKTHLLSGETRLRSKTPELVEQEAYALLMAHFVIRSVLHEAALRADEDPDRLSFKHALRVVRRRIKSAPSGAFSPSTARLASQRNP